MLDCLGLVSCPLKRANMRVLFILIVVLTLIIAPFISRLCLFRFHLIIFILLFSVLDVAGRAQLLGSRRDRG